METLCQLSSKVCSYVSFGLGFFSFIQITFGLFMTFRRIDASGISHVQSFIIFGGWDVRVKYRRIILSSTEIITEQGVSVGPEMPEGVFRHAVASVNETTSIISGGSTSSAITNQRGSPKTWFFNHVSQQFQTGPLLITSRHSHASATIKDHQTMENIVVVIGGWNYNNPMTYEDARLDSTELLINGESEWQQGKIFCKIIKM